MTVGRRGAFETLRVVASSALTGSYIVFGLPLSHGALIAIVTNNSSTNITISDDGTNDKDIIPSMTSREYQFGTNGQSSANTERLCLPGGTQMWINGSAGTGSIYLSVVYQTTS
jgi:hypothetical protein